MAEDVYVVRSWSDGGTTAINNIVEDNKGRIWRVMEWWEPKNPIPSTVPIHYRKLLPNGHIL